MSGSVKWREMAGKDGATATTSQDGSKLLGRMAMMDVPASQDGDERWWAASWASG